MLHPLEGKKIAFLATHGFEQSELTEPMIHIKNAGGRAELVSIGLGLIQGENQGDPATVYKIDKDVHDVSAIEYDGLVLPGGVQNPDDLRMDERAIQFVREFFEQHKPVAAICHGPWMLVEADVVNGRTLTSWRSLKTDIENAGGKWIDEEVVVDNGLVTSRSPDDLQAFCDKLVEEFFEGKHKEQTP
ncbi:MAG: type 1 glutamine amidotransferase domain-containing protein [Alphaproteobacteria bacterium]